MDETQALHQDHELVVVASYRDLDTARHDFATLAEDVEHHRFLVKGAALLAKDADGTPRVLEIGNHLGRKSAGLGAGIGILLGLFAPPFLGSLVLGAATGALFAGFASHELKIGLEHEIGRSLGGRHRCGGGDPVAQQPDARRA